MPARGRSGSIAILGIDHRWRHDGFGIGNRVQGLLDTRINARRRGRSAAFAGSRAAEAGPTRSRFAAPAPRGGARTTNGVVLTSSKPLEMPWVHLPHHGPSSLVRLVSGVGSPQHPVLGVPLAALFHGVCLFFLRCIAVEGLTRVSAVRLFRYGSYIDFPHSPKPTRFWRCGWNRNRSWLM